jgi:hypothetical protein
MDAGRHALILPAFTVREFIAASRHAPFTAHGIARRFRAAAVY